MIVDELRMALQSLPNNMPVVCTWEGTVQRTISVYRGANCIIIDSDFGPSEFYRDDLEDKLLADEDSSVWDMRERLKREREK